MTAVAPPARPHRNRAASRAAAVIAASTVLLGVSAGPAGAATSASRTYWGAIAVSPSTGRVTGSWDYPTRATADRAAIKHCGIRDCRAVVSVANGCAALAQASDGSLGWAWARSLATAKRLARSATHRKNPWIVGYVCTTRYR
jgi:hypothetical protein